MKTDRHCPKCGTLLQAWKSEPDIFGFTIVYECPGCGWTEDANDVSKILELLKNALALQEDIPQQKTIYLCSYIADMYYDHGDYAHALEFYNKELELRKMVLGETHPHVAVSYSNIGNAYLMLEDYAKSKEYYEMALSLREDVLGRRHQATGESHKDLGTAHACLKNYPYALTSFKKALEIYEENIGMVHEETCELYWKIAMVYSDMADYRSALPYLEKTVEVREKLSGLNHPKTAFAISYIGYTYYKLKEYAQSQEYFGKALAIQDRTLPEDDKKALSTCFFYAKMLCINGEYTKTIPYAQRYITAYPYDVDARTILATAYEHLGKYKEALAQHNLCLKLKREHGAPEQSIRETQTAIQRLAPLAGLGDDTFKA